MRPKPVPSSSAPYLLGGALLPLRAFLGFTFCFAGLQKAVEVGGPSEKSSHYGPFGKNQQIFASGGHGACSWL